MIESIDDQHTTETMNQIVSDVYSRIGEDMAPKMIEIADDPQTLLTDTAVKVVNALRSWSPSYECPTGLVGPYWDSDLVADSDELLASAGCAAFHVLLDELRFRIEQNEFAPSYFNGSARSPSAAVYFSIVEPSRLTPDNKDIFWDDPDTLEVEDKYQVMGESLAVAGDFLAGWLGGDETQWAWGRLHGLRLLSDVGGLLGDRSYDNPAKDAPLFANDGGLYTVDVADPTPTTCSLDPDADPNCEPFVQTWGASTRFVCEALPEGPSCTIQLPGGQSGNVESGNYEDLIFGYLENEPLPVVFDIEEAKQNAVRTVTFE